MNNIFYFGIKCLTNIVSLIFVIIFLGILIIIPFLFKDGWLLLLIYAGYLIPTIIALLTKDKEKDDKDEK